MKKLLLAVAMSAALVANAQAADPGITDDEITIGLFAPMSGPLTAFGLDALQAARMWYEETNKKGGIHGRKIKVITEDDKCSPNDVVAVVKKFVTLDKVFMVHGGSCTAAAVAAQEFVTREKVPHVMLNASGDNAVIPPTRYVFGAFGGTQRAVGATIAEFAVKELKGKRIALIAHDDDYGVANAATVRAVAKRLGAEVVAIESISPRITDVTAPMLNIRAANPDVIISTCYPAPAVLVAQKYAEFAMTKVPLAQAVQGIPVPAGFAKNVGNDAAFANFYYGSPLNDLTDGPKQQKWIALYKQHYPDRTPSAFMTYGLPSAMAITRALEKAGRNVTRESFIDALETVDFDSEVVAGPIAFAKDRRDAHRASIFVKYDGKNGHTRMPGVYLWDGKEGM
ncbi:MAG: ABC transporter substrate-binding protein [Alphaproteobacteria bacterium]|nr:ABC transporter substrate-binding protein [Alphaproteobacteria bacterium]